MGIRSLAARISLRAACAKSKSQPVSFPLELKGKSLLVLLPAEQRHLTVVKQILPTITDLFGDINVMLLAYPGTEVQSIFPTKGFQIMTPTKTEISWHGLPTHSFIEKIRKYKFAYVFEANLEENRFARRILLEFPQAVRFGNSGRLGLPYLNLEIKTRYLRDRHLIYASILEVLAGLAQTTQPSDSMTEEQSCT
jgi:hypothetical protein